MTICKRIFLRGDDAGLSVGTNETIEQAVGQGVLRNVSVMASAPAWEDAAGRFKNIPGVCIGLHVALNCEWDQPRWGSAAAPQLVTDLLENDGTFTRTPMTLHERKASVEQMMIEVEAGLRRLRCAGLNVKYLDDHMGVGWGGGLGQELQKLAKREGLATMDGLTRLKGTADFERALQQAPMGDYLLILHPDEENSFRKTVQSTMNVPQIAADRDADRRFLINPELPNILQRLNVQSCPFAQ